MGTVDELIAALEADGEVVSEGEFTLDAAKAKEKLRAYQIGDSESFPLELIQAAVLKGATRVEIGLDADDTRIAFDGAAFTLDDWQALYPAIFRHDADPGVRARRHLALGLNAALSLDPKFVHLTSRREGELGIDVRLTPTGDEQITETEIGPTGTHVHVRASWRPGLVGELFRSWSGSTRREALVEDRARWCSIPVVVNGRIVSGGPSIEGCLVTALVEGDGIRGIVGFEPEIGTRAEVRFLTNGVLVSVKSVDLGPLRLSAVVESDRLLTNVAESGVVENAAFDDVMTAVLGARERAIVALAEGLTREDDELVRYRALIAKALRREVEQFTSLEALSKGADDGYPKTVTRVPLWPHALELERRLALEEIIIAAQRHDVAPFSANRFENIEPESELEATVLLPDQQQRRWFRQLFGDVSLDATKRLRNRARGVANRDLWKRRSQLPVLGPQPTLARVPVSGTEIRGEIGLENLVEETSVFRWIKEGGLLARDERTLLLPGLHIAVEAPFEPTADFSNVRRDDVLARVGAAIDAALPPLFSAAAKRVAWASSPEARAWRRVFAYLVAEDRLARLLEGLGFRPETAANYASELGPRPIDLGPESDDPLRDVRCWPSVIGAFTSLAELQAAVADGGKVGWVHPERMTRFLGTDTDARAALLGGVELPQLVLQIDESPFRALKTILGRDALVYAHDEVVGRLRRAVFLTRPASPVEIRGALLTIPLELDGATGVVGLLDPRQFPWIQHTDGRDDQLFLTVLREGREMAQLAFQSAFGPLWATVDAPSIRTSNDWTELDDGERLHEIRTAVEAAVPTLVRAVKERWSELAIDRREPLRRALIASLWRIHGREESFFSHPVVRAVATVPIFPTVGGGKVSLAELRTLVAARRRVATVPADPVYLDPWLEEDDPVVWAGDNEAELLSMVFGSSTAASVQDELDAKLRDRRLENRPRVEAVAIPPGEALVSVAVAERELAGELGLVRQHLALQGRATITLSRERRLVGMVDLDLGLAVVGALDVADIALDDSLSVDLDHPSFNRLVEQVEGYLEPLATELLRAWPDLDRTNRASAWRHLLDFSAAWGRIGPRYDLEWATPTGAKVADVAGFDGADGRSYSLAEIARARRSSGAVYVMALPPRGQTAPDGDLVIIADTYEWAALESLFGVVVDYTRTWQEIQVGLRNRERCPPLRGSDDRSVVARLELDSEHLQGFLELPVPRTFQLEVDLGVDGLRVESRRISDLYPCAGVVSGSGVSADPTWRRAALSTAARTELGGAAYRLYRRLAREFESRPHAPDWPRAAAAGYLLDLLLRLHRERTTGAKKSRSALYRDLADLELFELPNSARISLREALVHRPASLERFRLWAPKKESTVAVRGPTEREPNLEPAGDPSIGEATPLVLPSDPGTPAPTPAAEVVNPVEALAKAITEELEAVGAVRPELLLHVGPDMIQIGPSPDETIASWTNNGLVVNADHPVVAAALDRPDDRTLVAVLVSALYSAANYHLSEVIDDDERRFVEIVARQLADRHDAR